ELSTWLRFAGQDPPGRRWTSQVKGTVASAGQSSGTCRVLPSRRRHTLPPPGSPISYVRRHQSPTWRLGGCPRPCRRLEPLATRVRAREVQVDHAGPKALTAILVRTYCQNSCGKSFFDRAKGWGKDGADRLSYQQHPIPGWCAGKGESTSQPMREAIPLARARSRARASQSPSEECCLGELSAR